MIKLALRFKFEQSIVKDRTSVLHRKDGTTYVVCTIWDGTQFKINEKHRVSTKNQKTISKLASKMNRKMRKEYESASPYDSQCDSEHAFDYESGYEADCEFDYID